MGADEPPRRRTVSGTPGDPPTSRHGASRADDREWLGLPTHLRIVGPLGAGGSGTVWIARDTRRGRDVALKLLDATPSAGADDDRFEREVRVLARLHEVPGVVTILECGHTAAGRAWLATELVEGPPLADLRRVGPLAGDRILQIAADLAATIARAHERGIAHGDLTPSNVLLDASGRPRVIDFGLARFDGSRGGLGCTPAFAAPERLRGAPPDPASDVYSLGATIDALAGGTIEDPRWDLVEACRHERPSRRPTAAQVADGLHGGGRGRRRRRRSLRRFPTPGRRVRRR